MCDNCEEDLITTSQGPKGDKGDKGDTGDNGINGVLEWNKFNLACWLDNNITFEDATEDEITQDFIDKFCSMWQYVNQTPLAVNDYRTMNQDTVIYIEVINNDRYYPDVTVTITSPPSNGVAVVESDGKTIKYTPTVGFIGIEDFIYTITDSNSNTSSATITIDVQKVITEQTIETTIINQLTTILASDDYWDIMFQLGDKILISNINLVDFDFSNPMTAGKGKTPGRYKKWAICNGKNATEDLTVGTFRGFDHTNTDYDASAKTGGSDSLNITLTSDNIPPHAHKYTDSFINACDGDNCHGSDLDAHIASLGREQTGYSVSQHIDEEFGDNGPTRDAVWRDRNTGNGTDNVNNQEKLKVNPDPITADIRNTFKTVIVIQKISM